MREKGIRKFVPRGAIKKKTGISYIFPLISALDGWVV